MKVEEVEEAFAGLEYFRPLCPCPVRRRAANPSGTISGPLHETTF